MVKKNSYLAKHDSFTLAQFDFNLETQQILFAMLYKINSAYIKPFEIKNSAGIVDLLEYDLDFNEIKNIVGIDYYLENQEIKVKRIIKDLSEKMVIFDTKEFYAVDGLIIQPVIDNIEKKMNFKISTRVKPFLNEVFRKFTKFGFKHLTLCKSKYTFRLYEILITKSKNITEDKKIIKISVEELRSIFQFPKSQGYNSFKINVLEKAKIEYNAEDIENIEEKKEKKLFKSFEYKEIITRQRGKGRNPVTDIIFEFELLEETQLLMMSKIEKLEKEIENEDWIFTHISLLIDKNKEREPYFAKLEKNYIYGFIIKTIENIKKKYNITGVLNQQLIHKTLESAFNKFEKKYKNTSFEEFLQNGFDWNINFKIDKGESLEQTF